MNDPHVQRKVRKQVEKDIDSYLPKWQTFIPTWYSPKVGIKSGIPLSGIVSGTHSRQLSTPVWCAEHPIQLETLPWCHGEPYKRTDSTRTVSELLWSPVGPHCWKTFRGNLMKLGLCLHWPRVDNHCFTRRHPNRAQSAWVKGSLDWWYLVNYNNSFTSLNNGLSCKYFTHSSFTCNTITDPRKKRMVIVHKGNLCFNC